MHAAHPLGLGAPIVGDRLYGGRAHLGGVTAAPGTTLVDGTPRLMLHAARLAFVHPHTGERITVERAAPF